jgi:hypothetical protein
MKGEPFERVAKAPEPGAVRALGRECELIGSNNFRQPPRGFVGIRSAVVIQKQAVVF